ncbi:hypothetical protein W59_20153 [Rhodococcus opacus RKJ300 = JCM 13270]|uniref:Uncharacterized protein n=1 Tax=Rhodococcus opacus RKJ300 = JCM 13270 TaxID=1165867 RepID=I0WP39_RHOOP|nr:hypothetical protein W59_20153 [Rhodococcus opacus RKJ300 = JCM 13270]
MFAYPFAANTSAAASMVARRVASARDCCVILSDSIGPPLDATCVPLHHEQYRHKGIAARAAEVLIPAERAAVLF